MGPSLLSINQNIWNPPSALLQTLFFAASFRLSSSLNEFNVMEQLRLCGIFGHYSRLVALFYMFWILQYQILQAVFVLRAWKRVSPEVMQLSPCQLPRSF
jgi:hypothetical protein